MSFIHPLVIALKKNAASFHPLIPFDPEKERLCLLDLSAGNTRLAGLDYADTATFYAFVQQHLSDHRAHFAMGGYGELRPMYGKSTVFNGNDHLKEPRRLHIGMDIWGPVGTPVYAPLGGVVHSVAMNNADGDYGATLVLQHQLDGLSFHTLYGHLSEADLQYTEGAYVIIGQEIGHFGSPQENGNWPPHLHFQLVIDMELREGDYPGVCRVSEKEKYLLNCPDPDLIARLARYL